MSLGQDVIKEFDKRAAGRSNWLNVWQILGEYISQVKQNFNNQPDDGEFLQDDVYDSTGTFAAHNCASALLGMLWNGSAKQNIEFSPPNDLEVKTKELAKFYEDMTDITCQAMDDPKANLALTLDEYMLDQVIFGTSGIGTEHEEDGQPYYTPYGVKEALLIEGKRGKVIGTMLCFEWEIDRCVEEFGIDKLSEKVREKFNKGMGQDKIKIVYSIKPRKEKKAEAGALSMPYEAVHVEYDTKHVIEEKGFFELPIFFVRFRKLLYEVYGRSPAMNALPDIREANALKEAIILATEKNLDPPQGIIDDGMLGNGKIDTSPGTFTVFNASGNIGNRNPIFPLVTVGSLPDALARLETLKDSISQHFFIDRLLDFNNDQQMTLGEAQIRDSIRSASLSALMSRQISEGFTPMIERTVSGMWRAGRYGVIRGSEEEKELLLRGEEPKYLPEEIVQRLQAGKDVYVIRYKTKAAQATRAQEYMSVLELMNTAGQVMAVDPSVALRIDFHAGIKILADIRGIPIELIRQDDEYDAKKAEQDKQQQAAMMLQAGQQVAGIAKDAAQAEKTANA